MFDVLPLPQTRAYVSGLGLHERGKFIQRLRRQPFGITTRIGMSAIFETP